MARQSQVSADKASDLQPMTWADFKTEVSLLTEQAMSLRARVKAGGITWEANAYNALNRAIVELDRAKWG